MAKSYIVLIIYQALLSPQKEFQAAGVFEREWVSLWEKFYYFGSISWFLDFRISEMSTIKK